MRGASLISRLRTGLLLSVLLHAVVCFVAATLPLHIDPAAAQPRASRGSDSLYTFQPSDPAQHPVTNPDDKSLIAYLVPPEPPPKPLTPEEIEHKITFGIDESKQKTPNWMGFANPTEHKAILSTVEQPQLDPNPGTPGAPSTGGVSQNGPQVPLVPNAMPADAVTQPADSTEARTPREGDANADPSKPTADKARDGAPDGSDRTDVARSRDGEINAAGSRPSQPKRGSPDLSRPNPNLPGPRPPNPDERGHRGDAPLARPDEIKPETPRKIEPIRAASLPRQILPQSVIPTVRTPGASASAMPTAPMPAGAPNISAAPGRTGERPGDKSPSESDASSTTPTMEIRPGQPAAAQGLNITTKRPNFTRYVRVTAFPQNPLLKVTFNHLGIVTKVVVVESSGVPDVDGPVVNAIYQWTAAGKLLAELSSGDADVGITVSIRILLN